MLGRVAVGRWAQEAPAVLRTGRATGLPPALLGALVFLAGQLLFARQQDPILALCLCFVGGVLIAWQFSLPEAPAVPRPAASRRLRRWVALPPLALGASALAILSVDSPTPLMNWAMVGGVLVLLGAAAAVDWDEPLGVGRFVPRPRVPGREALFVLALLAASLFVRVWLYDVVPQGPQVDSAEIAVMGREVHIGRPVEPFKSQSFRINGIHIYFISLFMWPGVDGLLGLTLAGAVPGTLAVLFLYLLVRPGYGPWVALAAAALFSFNRWSVLMTRLSQDWGLSLALNLAAAWCMWRALQTGRAFWFVLTGLVAGLGILYLYLAVIAPLLAAAVWLLLHRRSGLSWRTALSGGLLAAFVAACVFAPRVYAFLREGGVVDYYLFTVNARQSSDVATPSNPAHFARTVLGLVYQSYLPRPAYLFVDRPAPLLDPITAWLGLVGFGGLLYAAWQRRLWAAFWAVTGVLSVLVVGSMRGGESYSYRTIQIVPALAVGGTLTLVALARAVAGWRSALRWLTPAAVVLAIALVATFTYRDYFLGFQERDSVWRMSPAAGIAGGRWLSAREELLPRSLAIVTPEMTSYGSFDLAAPNGYQRRGHIAHVDDELSMPPPVQLRPEIERVWLLIAPEHWESVHQLWVERAALQLYGEPRHTEEQFLTGRPVLRVHEWDRVTLESRQTLSPVEDARCPAPESPPGRGWRGLMYVPSAGIQRLSLESGSGCAVVGLRSFDALARPIHLSRGWHEITVVGSDDQMPRLLIEREGKREPVPPWHLHAGALPAVGFAAALSEAPGAPPLERRYLGSFDVNWAANPPVGGQTFYVELTGSVELEHGGEYFVQADVHGPFTLELGGARLLDSPAREPSGLSERVTLPAGTHEVKVTYHAQSLNPTRLRLFPVSEQPGRLDFLRVRPA